MSRYARVKTIRPTGTVAKISWTGYFQGFVPQMDARRGHYVAPAYTPRGRVTYAPRTPQETKYFDTSQTMNVASAADWTGTELASTGYIQSDGTTVGAYTDAALIPSAVGAGYGQVNGNKYYLKKLRVKGHLHGAVQADQADVPIAALVRVVLVEDTQPNGAQAQGEEVFTDMGGASQATLSFLAMGAGSGGRFNILKDKLFTLNPAAASTDGASTASTVRNGTVFKLNMNFKKPRQVVLKANSAVPTVASLSNHNIFMLVHSSTTSVVVNSCARAYYCD